MLLVLLAVMFLLRKSDVMCSTHARRHITRRRRTSRRKAHHVPLAEHIVQKSLFCRKTKETFLLVGAGGFGPPKSLTTDLQSAPFGHSGTLPYSVLQRRLLYHGETQMSRRKSEIPKNFSTAHSVYRRKSGRASASRSFFKTYIYLKKRCERTSFSILLFRSIP